MKFLGDPEPCLHITSLKISGIFSPLSYIEALNLMLKLFPNLNSIHFDKPSFKLNELETYLLPKLIRGNITFHGLPAIDVPTVDPYTSSTAKTAIELAKASNTTSISPAQIDKMSISTITNLNIDAMPTSTTQSEKTPNSPAAKTGIELAEAETFNTKQTSPVVQTDEISISTPKSPENIPPSSPSAALLSAASTASSCPTTPETTGTIQEDQAEINTKPTSHTQREETSVSTSIYSESSSPSSPAAAALPTTSVNIEQMSAADSSTNSNVKSQASSNTPPPPSEAKDITKPSSVKQKLQPSRTKAAAPAPKKNLADLIASARQNSALSPQAEKRRLAKEKASAEQEKKAAEAEKIAETLNSSTPRKRKPGK